MEQQLVAAVAEELGLLDQQYHRLKQDVVERHYFSWGLSGYDDLVSYLDIVLVPRINAKLSNKKYLLVVENLYEVIELNGLIYRMGLPPAPGWTQSAWVMSTTSREVRDKIKSAGDEVVYGSFSDDEIMVLIPFALHQSAKHISKAVGQEDNEEHWNRVAIRCFHYALLFFPQHHEPPHADNNSSTITKDELIRQWAAQGFLTTSKPRTVQENIHSKSIRHHDDVYQVGNVILQAFLDFYNNTRDSVLRGDLFQSFYVQVAPCTVNIRRLEDEQDMLANKLQELAQKKSPYGDVYHRYMAEEVSVVSMATPPIRQTTRHVEMFAMDRYPHGLKYLLDVVKSITVTDDTYVSCLTDLSNLHELEDCKLRLCHEMKFVFEEAEYLGGALQNARVSQLKSLIHFYSPSLFYGCEFRSLKHLHLEYCPRLEGIMPRGSALPSLTTLDILFCYNLKTIFYQHPILERAINYQLPSLRWMRLQELPLLKRLHDNVDAVLSAPAWKELHVRGCWSLHCLPRLLRENPSRAVEVSGERA
ncbi:hypothetical protein E2562_014976 [Oryza meyeriana var. granulata]|uniref:Disease resistance protein At4g27190-like leucine-rich repeats domain-containing protein n=1 Tax=Oryza meyeriana var. granulata TaxID=110450 RepID=A0A6G1ELM2_9ORYZ|nr:hypothetical protein E2562_014976 [Oryza meyeriana var. granulata]